MSHLELQLSEKNNTKDRKNTKLQRIAKIISAQSPRNLCVIIDFAHKKWGLIYLRLVAKRLLKADIMRSGSGMREPAVSHAEHRKESQRKSLRLCPALAGGAFPF